MTHPDRALLARRIIASYDDLPRRIKIPDGMELTKQVRRSLRDMLNRRGCADIGLYADATPDYVWATRKG